MKRIVREIDPDIHYIFRDGKIDIFYSKKDISESNIVIDQITFEQAFAEWDKKPVATIIVNDICWVYGKMCGSLSGEPRSFLSIEHNESYQFDSTEELFLTGLPNLIRMARGM